MNNFGLTRVKSLFMFIYFTNEPNSSPSLGSTFLLAKPKHNNVFVKKLVSMRLDLNMYNTICLYVYIYKIDLDKLNIRLCKIVNKLLRYKISMCKLLII